MAPPSMQVGMSRLLLSHSPSSFYSLYGDSDTIMAMLKKAWITPHDAGLAVLSLESAIVELEYARLHVDSIQLPANPTPAHPLRHLVTIGLLEFDDLCALRDALEKYIAMHNSTHRNTIRQ